MKSKRFFERVVVALIGLGIVIPQMSVQAADTKTAGKPAGRRLASSTIQDYALTSGGTLTGRVVDGTGRAMEGATVTLYRGKAEIAATTTDKQGVYTVRNVKAGAYTLAAADQVTHCRLWAENTAPPAAKSQALLVTGQNVARGKGSAPFLTEIPFFPALVFTTATVAAGATGYALGKAAGTPDSPAPEGEGVVSPNSP